MRVQVRATLEGARRLAAIGLLALACTGVSAAQEALPGASAGFPGLQAGVDYRVIDPPMPSAPQRIDVVFFYNYADPAAAPAMTLWRRWASETNALVRLQGAPVPRSSADVLPVRFFYALGKMGIENQVSPVLYAAVQSGAVDAENAESWVSWLAQQGVDPAALAQAVNDPVVLAQSAMLPRTLAAYGVSASPSVVVAGRFLLSVDGNTRAVDLMPKAHSLVESILRAAGREPQAASQLAAGGF